ncbi:acetyl-coenzyme A synthetase N-terminal domain-containing protein, partial [Candidatus Erwinia dacicola]
MSQSHAYPVPANIAEPPLINAQRYRSMYQQSVQDPDAFWGKQSKILDWIKPYHTVKNVAPLQGERHGFAVP